MSIYGRTSDLSKVIGETIKCTAKVYFVGKTGANILASTLKTGKKVMENLVGLMGGSTEAIG